MARSSATFRIYRLKVVISALVLLLLGCALAVGSDTLGRHHGPHLLQVIAAALSDAAIVTGAIGIGVDFFTGRDREEADVEHIREVLTQLTPEFTDAVVHGFAATPDDLVRVATPELLDNLATNALALRLGDHQFAHELYQQVRDQCVSAPERWHDVEVRVRFSPAGERNAAGVPLFEVLVEWEYSVVPASALRRFSCTSDRTEFSDLLSEVPSTSSWLMTPRPGLDAADQARFELLYFTVDGLELPIRRTGRRKGQTYSVRLEDSIIEGRQLVRIKHVYRVAVAKDSHRLFLELAQPCRGFSLEVDYAHTDIERLSVSDLVSSAQKPRVSQLPEASGDRAISIDVPGWVLPRAGFTVVWTLAAEAAAPHPEMRRRPARPASVARQ